MAEAQELSDEHRIRVVEAMELLVKEDHHEDFTVDGAPKVKVVEDLVGFQITEAQRDEIWKAMNAEGEEEDGEDIPHDFPPAVIPFVMVRIPGMRPEQQRALVNLIGTRVGAPNVRITDPGGIAIDIEDSDDSEIPERVAEQARSALLEFGFGNPEQYVKVREIQLAG